MELDEKIDQALKTHAEKQALFGSLLAESNLHLKAARNPEDRIQRGPREILRECAQVLWEFGRILNTSAELLVIIDELADLVETSKANSPEDMRTGHQRLLNFLAAQRENIESERDKMIASQTTLGQQIEELKGLIHFKI